MKSIKLTFLVATTAVLLSISACSSIDQIVIAVPVCEGGSNGITKCQVILTIKTKSIGGGFDAGKLSMDTGQSSVDFSQSLVSATLVQKRNGVVIGNHSFQLSKSGDSWNPSNVQSLNAWIAANISDYDTMEIGIADLSAYDSPGTNIVVTEAVYDNTILAGGSRSWYVNSGGGDNEMMN